MSNLPAIARTFKEDAELPEELTSVDRWICWQYRTKGGGKPTKVPVDPVSLRNLTEWQDNPARWCSYEQAVEFYRANPSLSGVGFVLTPDLELIGLDLDDAINLETGQVEEWAAAHVRDLDTYTEVSPSGAGLRMFALGVLSPDVPHNVKPREIYGSGRWLTITGRTWNDSPIVANDAAVVRYVDAMRASRRERNADHPRSIEAGQSNAELVSAILRGTELHDATRNYAFRLIDDGMVEGKVVETVRGIMENSAARSAEPARWKERYADIPRLVSDAARKRTPLRAANEDRFTWGEVLTDPANLRPSEWTIRKVIPVECTGLLFGGWGTCKTFVAIDMAGCIANGIPWHGRQTRQGTVFYLAGEGEGGFARRMRAWELAYGGNMSKLAFAEMPDIRSKSELASLIEEVSKLASERGAPRLIVIDTLFTALNGGEENSGKDMGEVFQAMRTLRQMFKCAVLAIHHTGHDGDRSRGHSSMPAGVDVQFYLKAKEGADGTVMLELSNPKQKDGRKTPVIHLTTEAVELTGLIDEDGESETSLVIRAPAADLVASMQEQPGREELKLKAIQLRSRGLTIDQIAIQVGRNKSTVSRWFNDAA